MSDKAGDEIRASKDIVGERGGGAVTGVSLEIDRKSVV